MKKLTLRRKAQTTPKKRVVIKRVKKKPEEAPKVESVEPKKKAKKSTKKESKSKFKYGKYETLEQVCGDCSACKGAIDSPMLEPVGSTSETEVYFVKSSIRSEEDMMGVIGEDDAGNFIKISLLEAGFQKGTIRIGSAVRCMSKTWDGEYKAPYASHVAKCAHLLHQDIEDCKPKLIIASGSEALKPLTGRTGITSFKGKVLPYIKDPSINVLILPDAFIASINNIVEDEFLEYLLVAAEKHLNGTLSPDVGGAPEDKRICLNTKDEIFAYYDRLEASDLPIGLDSETHGLLPYWTHENVLVICLSNDPDEGYVVPLAKKDSPVPLCDREAVLQRTRQFLTNPKNKFILHNAYFDISQFRANLDVDVKIFADTMALSFLLNAVRGIHSLKDVAYKVGMGGYEDPLEEYKKKHPEADPSKKGGSYDNVPLDILVNYAAADAQCTVRAFNLLAPEFDLPGNENLKMFAFHFINDTIDALSRVSGYGMYIDQDVCRDIETVLARKISELEAEIKQVPEVANFIRDCVAEEMREIAGTRRTPKWEFKPKSVNQVSKILSEYMGLPCFKKTDTGGYSTDDEVLQHWADKGNEFCSKMQEMRTASKQQSTYVRSLLHETEKGKAYSPAFLDNADGCVRTSFRAMGTECSVGSTLITTDKGEIPIEELVVSREPKSFEEFQFDVKVWDGSEFRKPLAGYFGGPREVIKIKTPTTEITCTPEHPIATAFLDWPDVSWTNAGDLSPGDHLIRTSEKEVSYLEKIVSVESAGIQEVFDLTMDPN